MNERVLTWSADGTARLWGSMSGNSLTPPLKHKASLNGAVFSRDEHWILTWSADGTARVWDSTSGLPLTPPMEHTASVLGAVFSRDERWILTWSSDGTSRMWDSITGKALTSPLVHTASVNGTMLSQDEHQVLTWSADGTARVWDSSTGKALALPLNHKASVQGAVFNQDESRVLTWSADGTARLWDSTAGKALTPPLEHKGEVLGAMFSQDERRVLTWSADGTARLWDSTAGKALIPPLEHKDEVLGAVFSQDERRVLTWSADGMARVWDSATGKALTPPLEHKDEVLGAVFSQDERWVLTWSADGTAQVWDSDMGKALTPPMEHESKVLGAMFSQNGHRILTWSSDDTAQVWDLQADYDFPRKYLILQLEVQTGVQLNTVGEMEQLSPDEWWTRKHQYEEIARENLKNSIDPHANLLLNSLMNRPDSCDHSGKWMQEVNPDVISKVASWYIRTCLSRGNLYLEQQNYERAVRAFETTLQLQTDYPSASQSLLAEVYERFARSLIESRQDVKKGIEYAQKSLELNPHQSPEFAFKTLALGYSQKGQNIETAEAYLDLAHAYARWNEYTSALVTYQQALRLHPEIRRKIDSEYDKDHYLRTLVYLEQAQYAKAFQEYEQAVQYELNDIDKVEFLNKLGQALIEQKIDIDKGKEYIRKAQELYSDQFTIPLAFATYVHYFKLDTFDQWWLPGKNPEKILGPEPWRRDIWIGRSGDYPYIGVYDNTSDREIVRWHIRLAKASGITAFLLYMHDWQKQFPETQLILDVAAQEDFKIGIIEHHSYLGIGARGTDASKEDVLNQSAERISGMLNQWKSHPAYLRIDGKPFVVIPWIDIDVTPSVFNTLINDVKTRVEEDLYVVAIVPQVYWYFTPETVLATGITQEWADSGANAFTHWTPNGMIMATQGTRLKVTKFNVSDSYKWGKDPIIPVMPGFDDDAWRPGNMPAPTAPRNNGKVWSDQLDAALAARPRFLFIQAWNDWHEGSQIEPSTYYSEPYLYLKILAQKLQKSWQAPPLPPKSSIDPLRAPYLPLWLNIYGSGKA